MGLALPICALCCAALWVSIASTVTAAEILAGFASGMISAAAFGIAIRVLNISPRLSQRELAGAGAALTAIPGDIAAVLLRLAGRRGKSETCEYHFDPQIARFRPLEFWVILFGSFTPDSIVADIDAVQRNARLHQMKGRQAPASIRYLGVR